MTIFSSIPFAGSVLGRHRHVCAFFRTPEDEYQILFPFVHAGIEHGDHVVSIVPRDRVDYLDRLRSAGVDVDRAQGRHQLDVLSTEETYTPDGHFDKARMLAVLLGALTEGRSRGFRRTRLMGHSESALRDWEDTNAFLEYETRLNYVLPGYEDPVICTYDLNQVSAAIAFDVVRTHPVTVIGGVLQENPFFVPPDAFLEEQRARNEPRDLREVTESLRKPRETHNGDVPVRPALDTAHADRAAVH
jgi:hypothetical protein